MLRKENLRVASSEERDRGKCRMNHSTMVIPSARPGSIQMLIEEEPPDAVGKMKQFASWFTHGVPGGAGLRKAIYESKSAVEILERVEEFFEARLCGAGALAREVV